MENTEIEIKPIFKRKHKYYNCECGTECKVTASIKTDWYGTLEYMWCKGCKEGWLRRTMCSGELPRNLNEKNNYE